MKTKKLIVQIFLCLSAIPGFNTFLNGQITISLDNPSFEDVPRAGTWYTPSIKGWHDCGLSQFPGETPPDIHPLPTHAWKVSMQPYEGESYLGLVVRYNGTNESVSQELDHALKKEKCYSFSAFLARSDTYVSGTTRSTQLENFISPAVLRIWGGNNACDRLELLGQSDPVDNTSWKEYNFVFQPKEDYTFITIEAYYSDPGITAYNGHIMVDNLSMIHEMECK